jgi:hypothetical protein
MECTSITALYLTILLASSTNAFDSQTTASDGARCEAERRLCKKISHELDRINQVPYHVAIEEKCNHVRKVCRNVRDAISQLEGTGLLAPEMYDMYRACLPLQKGNVCADESPRREANRMEIDAAKILWQSRSNEVKYLGKILKTLPPRTQGEGWEYQYAGGNGTVGSKSQTLLLLYRYKTKPTNWEEALQKVGLPTEVAPVDFGTSLVWPARGAKIQPITFQGKILNRVILAKDFSEITIDGHEPGSY